jgi:serine O-acetyltransferase
MSFFQNLKCDLLRHAPNNSKRKILKAIFFNHAFHLVFFIRLGSLLRDVPIFGGALGLGVEYFIRIFFSSDISCRAKIGPGINIMHGHGIVIGSGVNIGSNCKIFDSTSFGNKDTETTVVAQPIIKDHCIIGTGAKIIGKITIGENSIIGANSVVVTDIPSNSVAAGVPARVIKKNISRL